MMKARLQIVALAEGLLSLGKSKARDKFHLKPSNISSHADCPLSGVVP
jgi:hypothetical protein